MKSVQDINIRQKEYYESRFEARGKPEKKANLITNSWTRARRRLQAYTKDIGSAEMILDDHKKWLGDLSGSMVLDLGCFSGNLLSLWIAENCKEYIGVDLSEKAVSELNIKLKDSGILHGKALSMDFLENEFPDDYFDTVYAHSVLHHFRDRRVVLQELKRIMKPGAIMVSHDPLVTEPLNRTARLFYRPFQSDRDWEWPFVRKDFDIIEEFFKVESVQGCRGMSMTGLPFTFFPFTAGIAEKLGRTGLKAERTLCNKKGFFLWACWGVSLKMVKTGSITRF